MLGPQVVNYTHLTATAISARACPNSALTFEHDSFFCLFVFFFTMNVACKRGTVAHKKMQVSSYL